MKTCVIIFSVICLIQVCAGQNYDADSIYYTNIPGKDGSKILEQQVPTNSNRLSYFFTVQSGALVGCKSCNYRREVSFSTATVHGVSIGKKLRLGAGLGFDTYQNWQTVPLFGSISLDLFGHRDKNAVFVQFNYGWSKAWASVGANSYFQEIEGGRMVSTQAGYRIRYHDLKISFGIGYKYQSVSASYKYPTYYYDYIGTRFAGESNSYKLQESMNRLSLMMILGWN